MHTHATKHATNRVGKMIPKNCHILGNVLEILRFPSPISRFPSPKIQFSSPKIQFSSHGMQFTQIGILLSSMASRFLQQLSDFLQWLSAFSNGFPNFSNCFPIFLNGFPLSEKSKKIYLWQEVYKRLLFELCIFCHLLPKLCNTRLTIPTSHPTALKSCHLVGVIIRRSCCFGPCQPIFLFPGCSHPCSHAKESLQLSFVVLALFGWVLGLPVCQLAIQSRLHARPAWCDCNFVALMRSALYPLPQPAL